MWWVYALLSAFFASLTAIFAKVGVKDVDADLATAIRTVVILVIAWGIAWSRGGLKTMSILSQENLLFLGLSGVATGLSWIFYFKALSLGEVSMVAPIDKLSVVLVVIFAAIFLGEPMSAKLLAGVTMIVVGTIILIW